MRERKQEKRERESERGSVCERENTQFLVSVKMIRCIYAIYRVIHKYGR